MCSMLPPTALFRYPVLSPAAVFHYPVLPPTAVLQYLLGLGDGRHTELPFVERLAVRAVRLVPETAGGYITVSSAARQRRGTRAAGQ